MSHCAGVPVDAGVPVEVKIYLSQKIFQLFSKQVFSMFQDFEITYWSASQGARSTGAGGQWGRTSLLLDVSGAKSLGQNVLGQNVVGQDVTGA